MTSLLLPTEEEMAVTISVRNGPTFAISSRIGTLFLVNVANATVVPPYADPVIEKELVKRELHKALRFALEGIVSRFAWELAGAIVGEAPPTPDREHQL